MRRFRVALVCLLAAPVGLVAASVTLPHAFSNGQVADADQVNDNFGALADALNDLGTGAFPFSAFNTSTPVACDATTRGAVHFDPAAGEFFGCNGQRWVRLTTQAPNSSTFPATSCRALRVADPTAPSGAYWIDPTPATTGDAVQVWCDMSYDGGGWTTIVNTLRPNVENAVKVTTPHADLRTFLPASKNAQIWKWSGEAWSEFVVECRTANLLEPTGRWHFVKAAQTAAVQAGLNDLIVNGNNASTLFGASGDNVCPTKYNGNVFCGHNNNYTTETTWGDGFQIGNATPNWNSLYFGATDAQGNFKCNQTAGYAYSVTTGNAGTSAVWTYRFR